MLIKEQRIYLTFCFSLGKAGVEALPMLVQSFQYQAREETQDALNMITNLIYRKCVQEMKKRRDKCIVLQGKHFEWDQRRDAERRNINYRVEYERNISILEIDGSPRTYNI